MSKSSGLAQWTVVICFYIALEVLTIHGQSCHVGTDATEFEANKEHSFYLNTQDPAQCDGTITEFNFCYYRSNPIQLAASYDFTFAVFRRSSSEYINVSEAFTTGRTVANSNLGLFGTFACRTFSVNDIPVQAGDVIGVCIYDPPDNAGFTTRLPIDMVSQNAGSEHFLMSTGNSGCGDMSVPNPVTVSSLNRANQRVLHIHADITPLSTTEPPTNPTTMGTTPPSSTDPPIATNSMTETESSTGTIETTHSNEVPLTNSPTTSTGNDSITMAPLAPADNAGVVAGVVVFLLVVIVVAVVILVVVFVLVKRGRSRKEITVGNVGGNTNTGTNNGMDNGMYSFTKGQEYSADYQEISATRSPVPSSPNDYEMEHSYESSDALEFNYYAEVGPLLDTNNTPYEVPQSMSTTISYRQLLEKNKEEDIYGSVSAYEVPATREQEIYAQLKTWGVTYIHQRDVQIAGHLGSGQFGSVEQGVWKRQGTQPVDVALKSLTKTSEEDKVKFLQEAAIMAQFRHPNVIMLHGVLAKEEPMMIAVEFAKKGDLRIFLLSIRPNSPREIMPATTPRMLLKFSQQVALGMQYLSAKGFVHRDLAARNVLVTTNNICKVADFGMSRDLADENYYVSQGKDKIPVKWTAPEAIHYKKYSTASDVWAYGCLLYEIWSIGHKPFEANKNVEVIRLIEQGQRLAPPPGTPEAVYELMVQCWHSENSQRPAFRDVVLSLARGEEMVLSIPEEDSSTNPLAGVLGAPLEAGENMYSQLQSRYSRRV
ncbi:uncharacterized protein LOC135335087 [Halichondria panicea]|uniref:uncharacterized protein LOC135335087 n=1 Tax=Halichondria panicea TaxID=6063 RepID=UPI00312BAE63